MGSRVHKHAGEGEERGVLEGRGRTPTLTIITRKFKPRYTEGHLFLLIDQTCVNKCDIVVPSRVPNLRSRRVPHRGDEGSVHWSRGRLGRVGVERTYDFPLLGSQKEFPITFLIFL